MYLAIDNWPEIQEITIEKCSLFSSKYLLKSCLADALGSEILLFLEVLTLQIYTNKKGVRDALPMPPRIKNMCECRKAFSILRGFIKNLKLSFSPMLFVSSLS